MVKLNKLTPEQAEKITEARVVPNLEGNGFVALGMRTSNMSVPEFSDYLEFIHAFAAREGVDISREDAA